MSATPGTPFSLLARPRLPAALQRLDELAGNLVDSWDRELRGLFRRLDDALYAQCGNNPKLFLMRVAQEKLERAASDRGFLSAFNRVLAGVDAYHAQAMPCDLGLDGTRDLIAYFCFEFGFQFVSFIEMIFNRTFIAPGDKNHIGDSGCYGLLHGVLNQWLVHYWHHLLGTNLGGRQKTTA